jgi:hypothetical protein
MKSDPVLPVAVLFSSSFITKHFWSGVWRTLLCHRAASLRENAAHQ